MTLVAAQAAFREIPPLHQVVSGPITFVAHCERDGIPFFGEMFVGYVPTSERLGPTTLRRMVHQAARHGEDSIASHVASMLQVCIRPAGIALVVRTPHDCVGPRLIDEPGSRRTTAWHGRYRGDRALRTEFLALCTSGRE
jgi:GTP cyclohydrolase IA